MAQPQGLTSAEAARRAAAGQRHSTRFEGTRTYSQIFRSNFLGTINISLLSIGLALIILERYTDAFISASIVVINVAVGLFQEIRAKRRLDHIALINRPKVTVIRDGAEQDILPDETVLGDVMVVEPGDQIIVDGTVLSGKIEVDESLLTGEEDLVRRTEGMEVSSGSICVTGRAIIEATRVGNDSLAARITTGARAYRRSLTPLQQEVNLILRVLLLMTAFFGGLLLIGSIMHDTPVTETVLAAAVIAGLVPPGLFLMITLNYAMAAVKIAGMDALVQSSNAIDSLSNVDILCLDKTGTLTANKLKMQEVLPIQGSEADIRAILGDFAANVTAGNKTTDAITQAAPGETRSINDEVPFTSARKWSALSFDDAGRRGVVALGAPEMLGRYVGEDLERPAEIEAWAERGLRVLLLTACPEPATLTADEANPTLPESLCAVAWICFADELRPHSQETLASFREAGIQLKVISGDNPTTVAALARQAGLSETDAISGLDLDAMSDSQLADAAEEFDVFGRITPQQKERLVDALRRRGHYVAMIGDGVNDVLSLKQANLGIAMESGSAATRNVADIVLLKDSFGALPAAFTEGRRIRSGMQDILKLFMVRVFSVAMLLAAALALQAGFPFSPRQISILSTLTVGVPVFFLALWARPTLVKEGEMLRSLVHFVVPAAITITMAALTVYLIFHTGHDPDTLAALRDGGVIVLTNSQNSALSEINQARDAITVTTVLCGLLLLIFVEPPKRWWVGGDEYSGDWRPTILAGIMFLALIGILFTSFLRDFFGMGRLSLQDLAVVVGVVVVWTFVVRAIWRYRLLDRLLGLSISRNVIPEETPETKTA
ncbi:MAG: HAD-IC family P-type ATPase [Thermomicrobiales bacterium]|nr:HAD-IC family P-type ATPase [Thermomicrobiales bacterium]